MNRSRVYLATIDPNAHILAGEYGLGLELSEFCTAYNMDEKFHEIQPSVEEKMKHTDRLVLHAPFNELFPCAILNEIATFDEAGIDDGFLEEVCRGDKFTVEGRS